MHAYAFNFTSVPSQDVPLLTCLLTYVLIRDHVILVFIGKEVEGRSFWVEGPFIDWGHLLRGPS